MNSVMKNSLFRSFSLQELQFQEQQEELQRELRQRSTQQLLEQTYYDNSNNSKGVDLDYCRRAYDKPQLITNVNNLNYQASSNCNYNTINHTSAKDILYELKQYEHFANNSNHQLNHINFNNNVADHQTSSSRQNGTNYSQNILNYNNSYYKINNINNYNYVKNQSSLSPSSQHHFQQQINRESYYSGKQQDKYLLNDKMERDESTVECSQLVGNHHRDTNGRNVTIHNFNGKNVASHTTIPPSYNNIDEDEEHHNANPSTHNHRSQHFTQVSR
jgi:hypothetical protein